MSVFIKGVNAPKSCSGCPFNESSLYCAITQSEIDRDDEGRERLGNCPITEYAYAQQDVIDLFSKYSKYQITWLTSHNDLQLSPVVEGWVIRFLRDTAEEFIRECDL